MQPYLFPYIGYFQLLAAVDQFVLYDDVTYRKQGWINRNRILLDGEPHMFTLSIAGASSYKLIKDLLIADGRHSRDKILASFVHAYKKAPYFAAVYPNLQAILLHEQRGLADFIANSLNKLCSYIGLTTSILRSSELGLGRDVSGQDRVLVHCRGLGASVYINAIGGTELYHAADFAEVHVDLKFLKTMPIAYPQFGDAFVANLSIVDVLMFNEPAVIKTWILERYTLQ